MNVVIAKMDDIFLFFQEKLVASMSREELDLATNAEEAVSANFPF